MFKKLTEFDYKRTALEAVGFWLAYGGLILLTAMLVGGFLGVVLPPEKISDYANPAGKTIAFVMCLGLSVLILAKKKLLDKFGYIVFVILCGFLPLLTGFPGGLVSVAFLTTRSPAGQPARKPSGQNKKAKKPRKR
jgi:uncharacterized membrane protein